ncbi:MAG: hypothetical protein QGH33_06100, partial [Pirellulaceae bacterium]|nr:hypothetical protein [Pirellulaceae bacterium]
PSILGPPAVIRLLTDAQLLAYLGHFEPLAKLHVRLTQLATICSAVCRFFMKSPFRPTAG